jgi:hypothetical protein
MHLSIWKVYPLVLYLPMVPILIVKNAGDIKPAFCISQLCGYQRVEKCAVSTNLTAFTVLKAALITR